MLVFPGVANGRAKLYVYVHRDSLRAVCALKVACIGCGGIIRFRASPVLRLRRRDRETIRSLCHCPRLWNAFQRSSR